MNVKEENCEPGLEEFLGEFLNDRQSELIALKALDLNATVSAHEEVRKIAHKWKGFAAPYGFLGLVELAENLSNFVQDGHGDNQDFQKVVQRIENYLMEKEEIIKRKGDV